MQKNELPFGNTAPARHFNLFIFGFFKSDITGRRISFPAAFPTATESLLSRIFMPRLR